MDESFRKVPVNYGIKWMACAWLFVRANYKACLITALVGVGVQVAIGLIPYIGRPLSIIVTPMIGLGFLRFAERLHHGEVLPIKEIFFAFKDTELMKKFAPIFVVYAVMMLPEYIAPNVSAGLGIILFFLGLAGEAALIFAVPLVYFKKTDPIVAMRKSFDAAIANIGPLLAFYSIGICISLLATLLLAVPLIFAVLPCWILLRYLLYKAVFDDLNLDALEKELEAKFQVAKTVA